MDINRIVELFSVIAGLPDPILRGRLLKKLNRIVRRTRKLHYIDSETSLEIKDICNQIRRKEGSNA